MCIAQEISSVQCTLTVVELSLVRRLEVTYITQLGMCIGHNMPM